MQRVLKKWVMLKNQKYIDFQQDVALRLYSSPFLDKKNSIKFEEVPFPELEAVKPKKFDREKAWQEAPIYDVNNLKNLI